MATITMIRLTSHLPSHYRSIVTVIFGEFVGTFMFLLSSFIAVQAAVASEARETTTWPRAPLHLLYIALSFGVSASVNIWIFYRVSGGLFNPAVTLALVLIGSHTPIRGVVLASTQIIAGIAAAAACDALTSGPLEVANTLSPGTSVVRGLFLEMLMTAQLVLTVLFLAVEKHRATYLAPMGIGLSVLVAHLCITNFTGAGINPARSFGPAVVTTFAGYHWIYWLGPFMGTFLSVAVYYVLKLLDYTSANPGQDCDDLEGAALVNEGAPIRRSRQAVEPVDGVS